MAENKIVGYKTIFGFVLPDWVDEGVIRLLVTLLLSSVVMLFVLIFVIWPKLPEIKSMKAVLKSDQAALDSLNSSKKGFDELNSRISELTQNVVLAAIPQTYSPESAIFLLRKISEETPGLSIVSYKLPGGVLFESKGSGTSDMKDEKMVKFITYPIQLKVSAPVSSLLTFISKVESSLPFGVVSDLSMQKVSQLAKSNVGQSTQMDLEISYYQAVLNQVDISKIEPISSDDLTIVKQISGFNQASLAGGTGVGSVLVATGSANTLFGF